MREPSGTLDRLVALAFWIGTDATVAIALAIGGRVPEGFDYGWHDIAVAVVVGLLAGWGLWRSHGPGDR